MLYFDIGLPKPDRDRAGAGIGQEAIRLQHANQQLESAKSAGLPRRATSTALFGEVQIFEKNGYTAQQRHRGSGGRSACQKGTSVGSFQADSADGF